MQLLPPPINYISSLFHLFYQLYHPFTNNNEEQIIKNKQDYSKPFKEVHVKLFPRDCNGIINNHYQEELLLYTSEIISNLQQQQQQSLSLLISNDNESNDNESKESNDNESKESNE